MESRIECPIVLSQERGQTDLSNRAHNLAELDGIHRLIRPACLGQITQVGFGETQASTWLHACLKEDMENVRTIDPERGERDVICSRCGREAEWMFLDAEHTVVEVTCPDCGKFEMLRTEFDQAESEIVDQGERE